MSNDLIVLEDINAVSIFNSETKDADQLIEEIRKVALSEVPDLTTAKGRKQIASNAAKVSKCKTYLEDAGKSLVSDEKARLKKIDGVRKKVKEALEEIRDEVRKPLTEWEDKEKERVEKLEGTITFFITSANAAENWMNRPLDDLSDSLKAVEEIKITKRFQEFEDEANRSQKLAIEKIKDSIEKREKYDKEQKELEELRELKAEKEENEKIAEAEEAAAQAERDRIEREKQAEIDAEKAREADKNHRGKVNRAIVKELLKCDIDEAQAKKIVTAIAKNKVPNVKISY